MRVHLSLPKVEQGRPRGASLPTAFRELCSLCLLLGLVLIGGCEYPGVERDISKELPIWFTGESPPAQGLQASLQEKPASEEPEVNYVRVPDGEVKIALKEYELVPDKIMVNPGKITFVLENEGRFSHDFRVEGPGIDERSTKFGPGRTIRLEVTLTQEGRYKISCPLSNHDERGMTGTLLVTSKLKRD